MPPSCGHNFTGRRTATPSHQYQSLLCLPAGVVPPVLYQGVAGDPLARGEGQAGCISRGVIPTTDEEAVHGVVLSISHQGVQGGSRTDQWMGQRLPHWSWNHGTLHQTG